MTFAIMITPLHFLKFAVPFFVFARREVHFQLMCGLAALAVSAGNADGQTINTDRIFPIRGGSQPFAITMSEDGNFWFTLSNSNKVARINEDGRIKYFRTPSLSNPAYITRGPDGNIWFGDGPYRSKADAKLARSTIRACPAPTPDEEKDEDDAG